MRDRAGHLAGTVKEIRDVRVIGCTVEDQDPLDIQQQIEDDIECREKMVVFILQCISQQR